MKMKYFSIWIIAICFFVFVLQNIPGFSEVFLLDKSAWIEPWRFLTSIFLHGSLIHLLYNMFALLVFGLILEKLIGSRKFILIYLITGIAANIVSVNFYDASLGASGAILGIIGALIIVRPMLVIWAFGMPMPIFIAGILWALVDFLGVINPVDNTANIAHLSGLFFGLIFGLFFRDWKGNKKEEKFEIDEEAIRRWEEANF